MDRQDCRYSPLGVKDSTSSLQGVKDSCNSLQPKVNDSSSLLEVNGSAYSLKESHYSLKSVEGSGYSLSVKDNGYSHKDSHYSWIVCMACSVAYFLQLGFTYSIGIYYAVFLEVFGHSAATTSWISSLNYGMFYITGTAVIKDTRIIACCTFLFVKFWCVVINNSFQKCFGLLFLSSLECGPSFVLLYVGVRYAY